MILFDSSTFILLAKIGLLRDLTAPVDIRTTPQIKEECVRGGTTDAKLIEQLILIKEKKISVLKVERDEKMKAES